MLYMPESKNALIQKHFETTERKKEAQTFQMLFHKLTLLSFSYFKFKRPLPEKLCQV